MSYTKKEKRKESKKRKQEVLLELTRSNEEQDESKKPKFTEVEANEKPQNNLTEEEIKLLRLQKRQRQKAKMEFPVFFLAGFGHEAELNIRSNANEIIRPRSTISYRDIQHLMLLTMLGRKSPHKTRWCKLMRYNKLSHSLILIVECLSADFIFNNIHSIPILASLFSSGVEIDPPVSMNHITNELLNVPMSMTYRKKMIRKLQAMSNDGNYLSAYQMLFPNISKFEKVDSHSATDPEQCDRRELLLDMSSMLHENYPFDFEKNNIKSKYTYTRERYDTVTSSSPLFAIDCEMCITSDQESELTRISIVDENLNVIYETLVKPKSPITDYLTRFSGITESLLKGVTTSLEDVQKDVSKLLPNDAILCGHSLNNDLHALKMMHPYVIDTSVIFNTSGILNKKPSLKNLALMYLGEVIQNSSAGHNPIEDSLATMKLVLLKLEKGKDFGNMTVNSESLDTDKDFYMNKLICSREISFFKHSEKEDKKVCIVGRDSFMETLGQHETSESIIKTHSMENNKEVIEQSRLVMLENDMTISHISFPQDEMSENSFDKLNKRIKKMYNSSALKSLFMVVFTGYHSDENSKNGVCFSRIKS